jgi:hypothetical protein
VALIDIEKARDNFPIEMVWKEMDNKNINSALIEDTTTATTKIIIIISGSTAVTGASRR